MRNRKSLSTEKVEQSAELLNYEDNLRAQAENANPGDQHRLLSLESAGCNDRN